MVTTAPLAGGAVVTITKENIMGHVVSFSLNEQTLNTIRELSELGTEGNRSRLVAEMVREFGDDYLLYKRQQKESPEIKTLVEAIRKTSMGMISGRTKIRHWDKAILDILSAGRAIGAEKNPEEIELFDRMVNLLILSLKQAQEEGWEELKPHERFRF